MVHIATSYFRGKFKTYCYNTIIKYKVHNIHYYTRKYNVCKHVYIRVSKSLMGSF